MSVEASEGALREFSGTVFRRLREANTRLRKISGRTAWPTVSQVGSQCESFIFGRQRFEPLYPLDFKLCSLLGLLYC